MQRNVEFNYCCCIMLHHKIWFNHKWRINYICSQAHNLIICQQLARTQEKALELLPRTDIAEAEK